MIVDEPGESGLRRLAWDDVEGWETADLTSAKAAFLSSVRAVCGGLKPLRPARPASEAFAALCARKLAPSRSDSAEAKAFFEGAFEPFAIRPEATSRGFLTGYYEPLVDGTTEPDPSFSAPVLDWPGHMDRPMPDCAAWEACSVTPEARPVLWLRDWTELFLVQVQGSARVRLTDGSRCRLVYAGRNGAPYTSIGRRLIEAGRIPAETMSLAVLKAWLRAHGQDLDGEARKLMQENRSYIFFRREADPAEDVGPIGGQGVRLRPGVSIAVDRNRWCYGLPFWIAARSAMPGFGSSQLRRLFIAQDTGSAIVGPARADLFLGSGEDAGAAAGSIRHEADFVVLLPRAAA